MRSGVRAGSDLARVGIYKEANLDPLFLEPSYALLNPVSPSKHIEPAFRGQLLAPLGNEASVVGMKLFGFAEHFIGYRHLQIELDTESVPQLFDIPLLNMAAVLPQMHGNSIRASLFRQESSFHRVGNPRLPRLSHGGNMIHIDAETYHIVSMIPDRVRPC
jgi:hypothetical protein